MKHSLAVTVGMWLKTLTARDRQCVEHKMQGLGTRASARQQGISRSRVFKVLKRLKHQLERATHETLSR